MDLVPWSHFAKSSSLALHENTVPASIMFSCLLESIKASVRDYPK